MAVFCFFMGKTKRVTVKNAKKVTWKVTKNTVSDAAAQTAQPTAVATEKTVFWRMMNPRFP